MAPKIEWKYAGGYKSGTATTKSGLRACIGTVMRTSGRSRKELYTLYIEGDERNAATRATLETVMQILEAR